MADLTLPKRSGSGSGGRGGGIRLPSAADVGRINPAAARDPGVRVSATAFGAVQDPGAAGRALAEVAKVGTEYAKFEDRREHNEAQLWQLKSLSEARNQWSTTLSEMSASAEEGAPGFEKNVSTAFDKYQEQALANAPERIRDEYGVRLSMLKGSVLEKAGDFARTSRVNKNVRDYERGTDADTNTVLNDPSQFRPALDLRLGILNAMDIPADRKAVLMRSAENQLSEAALSGRITVMKDPRGALASLNSGEWDKLIEPGKKLALIRLAETTSAVSKADANAMLRDHIASIRSTGVGVPGAVDKVVQAYDAKDMPRILADIDLAKRFHNSYQQLAYAPPQAMAATLESFKPKPGQQNFADQQQSYEEMRNAAQHLLRQRADDPAGYAASMPQVQALTKEATGPDATRTALRANLAGQEALGIPKVQQRVLSKAAAQTKIAELMSKPPADRGPALLQMQNTYKDQFPAVMRDLSDKGFNGTGLDPRTMVLAHVAGSPAVSQQMATALQVGSKELRDGLLPTDVSGTEKAVRTALSRWSQATRNGATGDERLPMVNGIAAAVEDLAISYVRNGETPADAAKRASDAVINDHYTFQDTYYIPKDAPDGIPYSPANIDAFLRGEKTREKLEAAGFRDFGSGPQFAPVPDSFTPQERGLIQYHRNNLLGQPLKNADGTTTTILITGVRGPDGREYNVPGYFDGKVHSPEEAATNAERAGWQNFPSYASPKEADAAAKKLHDIIERDRVAPDTALDRDRALRTAVESGYWATSQDETGAYLMVPFRGGGALPWIKADGTRYFRSFRDASNAGKPYAAGPVDWNIKPWPTMGMP